MKKGYSEEPRESFGVAISTFIYSELNYNNNNNNTSLKDFSFEIVFALLVVFTCNYTVNRN